MTHPAALPPDELLKRCTAQRSRGSGPGGQHRNKVETAVTLTHPETGISGQASERRSQQENQSVALLRLRVQLAIQHRTASGAAPGQAGTPGPSELWRSRVKGQRIACNAQHADFPAMLAEAMDQLAWHRYAPADAARRLGVSTSQLIKLISKEPAALEQLNNDRQAHGMKRLQKR